MIWHLILSHLLADYPLQPTWMVRNKTSLWVMAFHAAIHLVVMLVLVGAVRVVIWPYLLALALMHFIIDLGKNLANIVRPRWVIMPYAVDQVLHFLSIWLVVTLVERQFGLLPLPWQPRILVYVVGYLLVTYVWFISERVLAYKDKRYRQEVNSQAWSRMAVRALLLTLFLFVSNGFSSTAALMIGSAFRLPYISSRKALKTIAIDVLVAFSGMLFVRLLS